MRCVRQLDFDSVVNYHENEEQGVGHEVFLSIVTKILEILAHLFVNLYRRCVDGINAHKRHWKPHSDKAPKAVDLHKQVNQIDFFRLCWEWMSPRTQYLYFKWDHHYEGKKAEYRDEKLTQS